MNDGIRRGLSLLLGILAITGLVLAGLRILTLASDPIWKNFAIGFALLGSAFIIGKIMYNSIRSRASS